MGDRFSIGARTLYREGFRDIYKVLDGMTAWESVGYLLEKE